MPDTPRKRYLVFGYEEYYPRGGKNDIRGSFDHIEDAVREAIAHEDADILDLDTGEWIDRARPTRWDRSQCQEKVCVCHDDTAAPYSCTGCGCQPKTDEEPPRAGTDILVFDDLSHEVITLAARVKKGVWTVVANKRGYIVVRMPGLDTDSGSVRAYSNDLDYVTKALNS